MFANMVAISALLGDNVSVVFAASRQKNHIILLKDHYHATLT